jgi:hypothetical protein
MTSPYIILEASNGLLVNISSTAFIEYCSHAMPRQADLILNRDGDRELRMLGDERFTE